MEFSRNQIAATKAVEPISSRNLVTMYSRWCNCSPSISSVLMARKVPAEMDRNTASVTSPALVISQPSPIATTFRTAWPTIRP